MSSAAKYWPGWQSMTFNCPGMSRKGVEKIRYGGKRSAAVPSAFSTHLAGLAPKRPYALDALI